MARLADEVCPTSDQITHHVNARQFLHARIKINETSLVSTGKKAFRRAAAAAVAVIGSETAQMPRSLRPSVSVDRSVCHSFLVGRKVPCSDVNFPMTRSVRRLVGRS